MTKNWIEQRARPKSELADVGELAVRPMLEQLENDKKTRSRNVGRALGILVVTAVIVAVPALVAYGIASGEQEVFEAEADVIYVIEQAGFGDVDNIMANAKIAGERRSFADDVAATFEVGVEQFIDMRSVDRVSAGDSTTSILRFRVRDADPSAAERQLQHWVTAFVADSQVDDPDALMRTAIEEEIAALQESRTLAQAAIVGAESARQAAPLGVLASDARAQLVAELDGAVDAAGSRYDEIIGDLNTQARLLEQLEPQGIDVDIALLSEAHAGVEPVAPKPLRDLALGLAAGLTLGMLFLLVVSQWRGERTS